MTRFNSNHKFIASAFGAAAFFGMISFGSNAEAASVASCTGNTAGSVISCCERLTAGQRPLWMIQSRTSCSQVAACRRQKASPLAIAALAVPVKRCFVNVVYKVNEGGEEKGGGRRGRGLK